MRALVFVAVAAIGLSACTTGDQNVQYLPAQTITYIQPVAYSAPPAVYPALAYAAPSDAMPSIEQPAETLVYAEAADDYGELEPAPATGCSELVVC